jgi:hypothetical protein
VGPIRVDKPIEASRHDELLAATAEGPLFQWWSEGRVVVDVNQVAAWLGS